MDCPGGEEKGRMWSGFAGVSHLVEPLFIPSVFSPFRVQHMDLSNSVIDVSTLHGLLSHCSKLQNLSLEGLQLSDPIVKWVAARSVSQRQLFC